MSSSGRRSPTDLSDLRDPPSLGQEDAAVASTPASEPERASGQVTDITDFTVPPGTLARLTRTRKN